MMLEAEVILKGQGTIEQTLLPVMTGEEGEGVTFDEWLQLAVTSAKGMKLNFKTIEPVELCLQKLQEKGLIGKNKEQELPKVLQKVAIISSERAAGLQDFLNQITSNPYQYYYDLQIFPASMQGDLVVKEVLQQLKKIRKSSKQYDCVVIILGGGAKLDLNAGTRYYVEEVASVGNFNFGS